MSTSHRPANPRDPTPLDEYAREQPTGA